MAYNDHVYVLFPCYPYVAFILALVAVTPVKGFKTGSFNCCRNCEKYNQQKTNQKGHVTLFVSHWICPSIAEALLLGEGRSKPGLVIFIICRMCIWIFNIKFGFTNFTFGTADRHRLNCSEFDRKGDCWRLDSVLLYSDTVQSFRWTQTFWETLTFLFISQNTAICLKTFSNHVDKHYTGEIAVSVLRLKVSTVKMR